MPFSEIKKLQKQNKSHKDIGLRIPPPSPFNSVFKKRYHTKRQTVWSAAGRVKKVVLWQKKPGCLWLSIWTCRPACKTKLEFSSKFYECLDSAFWVDLVLTHKLVIKFVPMFPHKLFGLLEARILTLDCKVSHIIDSGWVVSFRNKFAPVECSVAGLETSILQGFGQKNLLNEGSGKRNLLNFQCSAGTISGETPNCLISSDILLLASIWLGFLLSHTLVLPKLLLTWKGRRQRLAFMCWILCFSKVFSQPGLSDELLYNAECLWHHVWRICPQISSFSSAAAPCKQTLEAKQHPPVGQDRESFSNSRAK